MQREDIELIQTCGACPEQYDAIFDGKTVGYLRLRYGHFSVNYPYVAGELIYSAYPSGDGIFDSDEREHYLNAAKDAIIEKLTGLQPSCRHKPVECGCDCHPCEHC